MNKLNFQIALIYLAELAFLGLMMLVWSSNRGFEFTDESYYVLSVREPQESSTVFYYNQLISGVFGWMNIGIVGLRLIRLLLTALVSFVLAAGIRKFLSASKLFQSLKPSNVFLFFCSFSFIGLLTSYAFGPQALSYNSMTVLTLAAYLGVLLFTDAVVLSGSRTSLNALFLLQGIAGSLAFYSKFSAGIGLVIISQGYLIVHRVFLDRRWFLFVKESLFLYMGMLISFVLSSIFFTSVWKWIAQLPEALSVIGGHDLNEIWNTYLDSLLFMWNAILESYIFIPVMYLLIVFLMRATSHLHKSVKYVHWFLQLVLIYFTVQLLHGKDLHLAGISHVNSAILFYCVILLSAIALFLTIPFNTYLGDNWKKGVHFVVLFLVMFGLPVLGSVGTNNGLNIQMLFFMFSWSVLITFILLVTYKKVSKILSAGLFFILVTGSLSQAIHGTVYRPYRITTSLFEQKQQIDMKTGDHLLVDPATAARISEYENYMHSVLKTDERRPPMILFLGAPGWLYLAQTSILHNSWLTYDQGRALCYNLEETETEGLEDCLILLPSIYTIDPVGLECMRERGIDFPKGYRLERSFRFDLYRMDLNLYVPVGYRR